NFNAVGSTINFDGIVPQFITSSNFNNVTFSGNNTKTANGILSISGNLSIENGATFDANAFGHTIGGNWKNNGVFTTSGSIELSGANKEISGSSQSIFHTLLIPGTIIDSSNIRINENVTVSGSFTQVNGTTTFGGTTELEGVVNLNNVSISNAKLLRLLSGASLGVSGTFSIFGQFDATTNSPTTVEFNGGAQTIPSTTFDNLTITNGSVKTSSNNLIVNGELTIDNATTFNEGVNNSITIKKSIINSGTYFGAGTIQIQGLVTFSGTGVYNLNNFSLLVNADSLIANDVDVNVAGTYTNFGTLVSNRTVTFNGNANQNIVGNSFHNVVFSGDGIKSLNNATGTIFNGSVSINAVTVSGSVFDYVVKGNWTNTGIFISAGTVVFQNTQAQTISGGQFYNIVYKDSGTKTLTAPLIIQNIFAIETTATVIGGNFTHTVGGNWINNGNFVTTTSTKVKFNSSNQQNISGKFSNIEFTGSGTKMANSALTILGSIIIDSNTIFNGGNFTHTIGESWYNYGTYNANNGTVQFTKNDTALFVGNTSLNNIIINIGTFLKVASSDTIFINGTLIENGYLIGAISKTENISLASTDYEFGNIGAVISFSGVAVPGNTKVVRITGKTPPGFEDGDALTRFYSISSFQPPASGATLTLKYDEDLDIPTEQIESSLKLWKGNSNGTNWENQKNSNVNSALNVLQLTNVTEFSLWGISSNAVRKFDVPNGSWLQSSNWSPRALPTNSDSVYIPIGKTALLNDNDSAVCSGIFIEGSLSAANSSALNVFRNWNQSSSLSFSAGLSNVYFSGANQTISTAVFGNVVIGGTGVKSFAGDMEINGKVVIKNDAALELNSFQHTLHSDFENRGTISPSTSTVIFSNGGDVAFAGNSSLYNLSVASGTTLHVEEGDTISFQNNLNEAGYITGAVRRTELVSSSIQFYSFGNIGATIYFDGVAPLLTTIVRTTGTVPSGFDETQAVKREYFISSQVNPSNATLRLAYDSIEINELDSIAMKLWRSTNNGISWIREPQSSSTGLSVTISSLTSFSKWAFSSTQIRKLNALNGAWNITTDWSPTGLPTATDSIIIQNGNKVTIPENYNAIAGSIYIFGELSMSSGTLSIQRNWLRNENSIFTPGNGTVIFNGTNQNIAGGNFANVLFTNTGIKTVAGDIEINDSLQIAENVTLDISSIHCSVGGNWNNAGQLISSGVVNFNGNTSQSISAGKFFDVEFSGNGVKNLSGTFSFRNVTINAATVDGKTSIDSVKGNWNNNGTFLSSGVVVFCGSLSQSISQSSFNNIAFIGNGLKTALGVLNILGNVTLYNSAEFNAGNFEHFVGGNWTKTQGSIFDASASTIHFNGATSQIITESNFNNIRFTDVGEKSAFGALTIDGDVMIESSFDGGNFSHIVKGNWNQSGTFYADNGTIIFENSSEKTFVGNAVFNILQINTNSLLAIKDSSSITINDSLIENGYISGTIEKSQRISQSGNYYNFGGIGASIYAPDDADTLGLVTIKRKSGKVPPHFDSTQAIERWYKISAARNSQNVEFQLNYNSEKEQNGQTDSLIKFWKSVDNENSWKRLPLSEKDAQSSVVSYKGIDTMSSWAFSGQPGRTLSKPSGSWTQDSVWSPGGVPTSADSVYIPANTVITLDAGANARIGSINIAGTLTVAASDTFFVFGNWNNSGTFNPGNGTVVFDSANQKIGKGTFHNLLLRGTGTKTLSDSLSIANHFVISGVNFSDNGNIVRLGGNLSLASSFLGTGTTVFNGNTSIAAGGNSILSFHNVIISGILDDGGNTLTVSGDWQNNGSFVTTGSTFFTGTDTQTVSSGNFNMVEVDKNAGVFELSGNISIADNFTLTNGIFSTNNHNLFITGSAVLNSGTLDAGNSILSIGQDWINNTNFVKGNSTIIFNGNASQTIGSTMFHNLSLQGNGTKNASGDIETFGTFEVGTSSFSDGGHSVSLHSDLIVSSNYFGTGDAIFKANTTLQGNGVFQFQNVSIIGTLNDSGKLFFVKGDFTNSGIFNSSGTINFNGNAPQQISSSNFNTIIFSSAGNKIANGNLAISGNVQIDSGSAFTGNNFTHIVTGNWFKHTNATFNTSGTTITMNGSSQQSISESNFFNLILQNSGEKFITGNLHLAGNFENQSLCNAGNSTLILDSNFINTGAFQAQTSTVNFTQNGEAFLSGSTTEFNNLSIANGALLNISESIKIILKGELSENGNGYVNGRIEKTENLITPNSLYTFGNIGAEMKYVSQSPGLTTVQRITNEIPSGFDSTVVIKRAYYISAENSSADDSINLYFSRTRDLNGQTEPQLKLWTSPDSGKHWTKIASSVKHPFNTLVSCVGIDTLQYITMSSSGTRLFSSGTSIANWDDSSKWSPKGLPSRNDSVVIPPGLTCVIRSNFTNAECGDITILNTGTLAFVGNDTLKVYGDWKNNGNFSEGASSVFFVGNNQTMNSSKFHHLIIGGSGVKTAIGAMIVDDTMEVRSGAFSDGGDSVFIKGQLLVNSNYTGSGAIIFEGNTKLSGSGVKSFGDVRIETASIFNDDGTTYNIAKNWLSLGTFISSGTAIFNGNNNTQIITSPNFYNIIFKGTSAKSITGNLSVANNLTIDSNSSFVSGGHLISVGGDWTNNGTFTSAGNGAVTLTGNLKKIDGTAITPFNNLTVSGSISTTRSFDVIKNLNVSGVLRQTKGNVVFGYPSITSTISGNAQLKNVSVPSGNVLRLNAGAVLGIAGTLTYNNNFDAVTNFPTRIEINGDTSQIIPSGSYINLVVKNGNTKTAAGFIKINDTLTVDTLTTFSDGGDTTEVMNTIINRGIFRGSGSAVFLRTVNLTGSGLFDFYNLTIGSGDTLLTDNLSIHSHGNFFNNGKLISTGKFIFDGSSDQLISGSNFNDFEILGRGTKTVAGNLFIERNVTVNDSVTLNFGSSLHRLKGNIFNLGTIDSAKILFIGDSLQTIQSGNPITFDKVIVDKNQNNVVLSSDIHVADSLRLIRGDIVTNARRIFLDSNSSLVESPNNTVLGTVVADRFVSTNTNNSFNGIGFEIFVKNNAPGRTVITRKTGTGSSFNGVGGFVSHTSIPRNYEIQPTVFTNLNATIKLHYNDPSEFSGQDEKTFRAWVSRDSAHSWYGYSRSLLSDSTQNFVAAESVMNISRNTLITLADNLNALQSNVIFAQTQRISDTLSISDSTTVQKKWSLSIRKNSPTGALISSLSSTDSLVVQDSIEDGIYYVIQSDSVSWRHFAYTINGNLFISSSNAVPVVVNGGTRTNVEFLNFHPNRFNIKQWLDKDSNLATTADRVLIPWGYTVSN
ncbi:MAG: hypothetical protein AAB071_01855, partial [Bacteroidota bacterium]